MALAECSNANFDVLPVSCGFNLPACMASVAAVYGRSAVTAQIQCFLVVHLPRLKLPPVCPGGCSGENLEQVAAS